jgi:hypothetical protein
MFILNNINFYYDDILKTKNKKHLKIKYIISGCEDNMDIINEVILLNY